MDHVRATDKDQQGVSQVDRVADLKDAPESTKFTQAAVMSLLFMLAEICLAFRALRNQLHAREALLPEDEELINQAAAKVESIQSAYEFVEKGFNEKYGRVRYAMDNPQEVEESVLRAQYEQLHRRFGNTAEPPTTKAELVQPDSPQEAPKTNG